LAELQKQLIEERQILELRQLQAANGGQVNKIIDNSLDWMYEGPSAAMKAQQQLSSEEYLLGKIYNGKDTSSSISNSSFMNGKDCCIHNGDNRLYRHFIIAVIIIITIIVLFVATIFIFIIIIIVVVS